MIVHLIDVSSETESDDTQFIKERDKVLEEVDKVNFPLYSILSSVKSDGTQQAIGSVPVLFYWTRRLKPFVFNRMTGE